MLVAQQKQKENIAEYIIYMYQIEDIIRAYNFDVEAVLDNYVRPQLPDASFIEQYRTWYSSLIAEMRSAKIEKTGHLPSLQEIMIELSYLHNTMVNLTKDVHYVPVYESAVPYIEEFQEKSDQKDKNHTEAAFQAIYMKLLLRLQKKEISAATEEAFDAMRVMIAYLSQSYKKMKEGDLDFLSN
ncbi:MAG: DUF4924 family protein [Crocinitomicaceae bacterium]|nr:DUF4924 family protein [Crocinitomicaceae bacterium]MDG1658041.1 DUF4924 family protein [Crocinitomicaceae bacterium]MDG2440122.1 DUF4924 family protein [Crocinitomicaceae bacterium]